MKLTYKQTEKRPENSFLARQDRLPCIEQNWHFHKELELIYFIKSSGTRYVGNSIGSFGPGELYLIGSNVPHLFKNHKEYYQDQQEAEAVNLIVIKFESNFLGREFLELTESQKLKSLFQLADRGIKFSKATTYMVHNLITGLVGDQGLSSVVGLLKVLDTLSISENYKTLCSEVIANTYNNNEKDRMGKVITFLTENFEKKIELEKVASIAHMTPNAFCRYFKKRTRKSFTQYLNEIRLRNACKLLIEGEMQISTICYQSGFNTLTNFNRQFKALMNITPTEYMHRYNQKKEAV
ncbi:AraC family transcriptional regulator [Zobellia galactanivorans]|uniref:AraC-type transcriptional regulator n=1 Tax=Zobellia galactanivorans (strain DSM 12802 / CCUG 47099 / CIP 106680 / NCIMB 13871 / Dsij) TaxID=63186 RepID=G0L7B9_ZOBGA|nr:MULTISPECIES: AraC family transcriptional regulator [Zobellia]MBU3025332.1 AraC family transcriptional regulator [Zobellia galactanivorans]MDO6810739.1 AraC family transcriptional regulator [Zobellia galactanivorans]OWW23602.1 AraC family transcriptional regulator [Zobellia sp. OII3]CAZ97298.1 AraC-type transcriptional regulator [Zobellia galactanivorans]